MTPNAPILTPLIAQTIAQSFGNDPSAKYVLLGAVVLVILYVVFRPFLQKKKKDPLARPAPINRLSQQRGAERQMETLLVELNEMARQMSAQLDTRAAKLEAIILDADSRIAELRRLTDAARDIAAQSSGMTRVDSPGSRKSSVDFGRIEDSAQEPIRESIIDIDPTHARVHLLADEGNTVGEIAALLGRPSGEVELILALRPKATR